MQLKTATFKSLKMKMLKRWNNWPVKFFATLHPSSCPISMRENVIRGSSIHSKRISKLLKRDRGRLFGFRNSIISLYSSLWGFRNENFSKSPNLRNTSSILHTPHLTNSPFHHFLSRISSLKRCAIIFPFSLSLTSPFFYNFQPIYFFPFFSGFWEGNRQINGRTDANRQTKM